MVRAYSHNGNAGCVQQRRARQTGTLVGVYHGLQSGLERDGWITLCEEHHNLVAHPSLALARAHAADPLGWCEDCRSDVGLARE